MRALRPLPRSELLEVVTVGLPFCVFKALGGVLLDASGQRAAALILVTWAAADFVFNLWNLGGLLFVRRRIVGTCTLAALGGARTGGRHSRGAELGTALDVLVSFVLVACVVGLGFIPRFTPEALRLWNGAVVLNVLGAGLARFAGALRSGR